MPRISEIARPIPPAALDIFAIYFKDSKIGCAVCRKLYIESGVSIIRERRKNYGGRCIKTPVSYFSH
jgi:hypothetical protein